MRARYLVGADGARSHDRRRLGLRWKGSWRRAATAYVLFTADLTRYVAHRPSILYWIMTPAPRFGEIGMGTFRAIHPWNHGSPAGASTCEGPEPDFRPEEVKPQGSAHWSATPTSSSRSQHVTTWYVNQACATLYSSGRVFCGGDAVHRHPPSSGLGSNTSHPGRVQPRLEARLRDQRLGRRELLDSYTLERAPVGRQVVARANQSRVDYGRINECSAPPAKPTRSLPDSPSCRPQPDGWRPARHSRSDRPQGHRFNAQGIELNQRYVFERGPARPERRGGSLGTRALPTGHDAFGGQAAARVAGRAPGRSLDPRRHRERPILATDRPGRRAWTDRGRQLDLGFLRTVVIGAARGQLPDWASRAEIDEAGAILVRPDGYVAWRHASPVWDDEEAIHQLNVALERVLNKPC